MSTGFVARSSAKHDDGQSVCSSSSSSEGPRTTTGEESHHDGHDPKCGDDSNRVDGLALRDAGTVRRAKICVFVALVLAAAGIGTLIYFLTTNEEAGTCQQTVRVKDEKRAVSSPKQRNGHSLTLLMSPTIVLLVPRVLEGACQAV